MIKGNTKSLSLAGRKVSALSKPMKAIGMLTLLAVIGNIVKLQYKVSSDLDSLSKKTNYDNFTLPSSSTEDSNSNAPTTQEGASGTNNRAVNAVIHVGPHKTGTTAIQHYSKVLHLELASDKYEMPWKHLKQNVNPWSNQVGFATCFLPERAEEKVNYPCREDLLEAGLSIAQQNNNSLLVSAETFANAETTGVAELKKYLGQAWSNVTIVATYRRYYEWVVSLHCEINKIKRSHAGHKLWQAIQKNETERLYPSIQDTIAATYSVEATYTVEGASAAVIARYKEFFPNVVVLNYHDKRKSLLERFYCDAIPHALNTCKKAKEMMKNEVEKVNESYDAVYEELTYAAHRSGMINVHSKEYCEAVTIAIKAHQEKTLKLSSDVFPRACPSGKILDEVWDTSLRSEKDFMKHASNGLGYEDEGSLLSNSLKDDFDVYSKTRLCDVDVHTVLQSQVWRDFFAEEVRKVECNLGYLQKYPDVANEFQSGLDHWVMHGKKEGRKPYCKEWMDY